MITVSVCMIVKNEEKNLANCLDCLKNFADEIIIVDTGSKDRTKKIAEKYTDKVYDYEWIDDFAAARNYSFSKATMDYIYVADADELIDEKNQKRLNTLKKVLLDEIEIVQMKYTNQLNNGSTYNYNTEYRGKLYKRLRKFSWIDPIHETINCNPVIYDSDVEIIHNQHESHAKRDLELFDKIIKRGERLSDKLISMYAKELFIAGSKEDFLIARDYFKGLIDDDSTKREQLNYAACVVIKASRILEDYESFLECAVKMVADCPSSEICCELGEYYYSKNNYKEATIWYFNAANECEPIVDIHCGGDYPLHMLSMCYKELGNENEAKTYLDLEQDWKKKYLELNRSI